MRNPFSFRQPAPPRVRRLSFESLEDRRVMTTELISTASNGTLGNEASGGFGGSGGYGMAISADGRYIALQSYASNLVAGDKNIQAENMLRKWRLFTYFTYFT